jgi:hypothetical protein
LETKWQLACVSVLIWMAGMTASSKGDLRRVVVMVVVVVVVGGGGRRAEVLDSASAVPCFLAAAADKVFLLARWARFSVARVSLRNMRSNSSLYPGHCRLDLALHGEC